MIKGMLALRLVAASAAGALFLATETVLAQQLGAPQISSPGRAGSSAPPSSDLAPRNAPQNSQSPNRLSEPGRARSNPATPTQPRRKRSYADCNRAAHRRDLRGVERHHFVIRCQLGIRRPWRQSNPPRGAAGAP